MDADKAAMTQEHIGEIAEFISRYLSFMLGAGVHTSRVIRNSKRIGEALGVDVHIYTSQKTMQNRVSLSVFVTEIQMCEFARGQADQSQSPTSGQQVGNFQDGDPFIRGAKAMQTPVPPASYLPHSPSPAGDEEDLQF